MADPASNGVLLIDKPPGPTSHDVVAIARRALNTRRIGHTGTLDPFASGLLILLIGNATRLAEYFDVLPKTYVAVMRLGAATDTDDRTGNVIASTDSWRTIAREDIEAALRARIGRIEQVPPAYSARKQGGERLYQAARRGETVVAQPAVVTVHALRITGMTLPDVSFEVTCSTGTYIRAIARDVGSDLKCNAHLVELRRTAIGPHRVEDAVPADRLDDPQAVQRARRDPLHALAHMPAVSVDRDRAAAIMHGAAVTGFDTELKGTVAVSHEERLIAVAEAGSGVIRPRKVFA